MSDIRGSGYGSSHDWERKGTKGGGFFERYTHYRCRECKIDFIHHYNLYPDIFKAIELSGINNNCNKNKGE